MYTDIFEPDPDPSWIWPNIENLKKNVFFIPFKVDKEFYSKIIFYKNRILPYYTFFKQKKVLENLGMIFWWFGYV